MDIYVPEIALKQPKADPRTVLLRKRNYLDSPKDCPATQQQQQRSHFKMSNKTRPIATQTGCPECDRLLNDQSLPQHYHNHHSSSSPASASFSSTSSRPVLRIESQTANTFENLNTTTSHSKIFVNLYESRHFKHFMSLHSPSACLENLYKFQKTKLLLILLFIYCAISSLYLPTTQAIPVRRTTTSGQRLILHSNVYRERYHQNLLHEQRQHQQHQQQVLQKFHQYHHQQQQQQPHHKTQHRYSSQHFQQVQRPSSYLAPILRKVHRHQLQHHHLHQRAAPIASRSAQYKMSNCRNDDTFNILYLQMDATLQFIKAVCSKYLQTRENKTLDEMNDTWRLLNLEIRNPRRQQVTLDNELHQKMHDFYLNLHNFQQLAELVDRDTNDSKVSIEHGEGIRVGVILEAFQHLKTEITRNMQETEGVLKALAIDKPNLEDNVVEFNTTHARRLRDFLIIKEFIEDVERVKDFLEQFCNKDSNGFSSGDDE
ncbi:mastermind-like domain-containing protein 1 isoform X2 [Musca domestica]|uniref:Mastermind-like domain-containing protein 1 isoform X2 n=1 Tax=Musca domestica TaxID=7370 RepID=A0ABM3UV92_MUSDO|nr:mastermind-like domain-containing protein 1 isoform X2 [Musca domestica]